MSPPRLYHHAHHTWHGTTAFIIKIILNFILLTILLFINQIAEHFLGKAIISYLIITIIIVLFTIYTVISHFTKANFFYLVGWIVGLIILYKAELPFIELDTIHMSLYIGIPTIMFIVRFIVYLYSDREKF